jgi:hypothetical protein
LYIFPFKKDKKTFDDNKDELGFSSKIKQKKPKKSEEQKVEELRQELLQHRK